MFLVLVLAAAGVPPFLGFWPKLMLLQAALGDGLSGAHGWDGLVLAAALLAQRTPDPDRRNPALVPRLLAAGT